MTQQTVTFYNGNTCPILGLGTWKSKPHEVIQAVKDAIDIGYRHIDCAPVYRNEKEVGAAIAAKIKEGVIKREDIFVTSKLWNTKHRPERVEPALKQTLDDLGLEYLDLYLIHSPMGFKDGDDIYPVDSSGKVIPDDTDYVDTWKAMEKLLDAGLVKNIGVSNFNSQQLDRVLSTCRVKPVTNQVECSPYYNQSKLSDFCKAKKIIITAYSPFGAPDRSFAEKGEPKILEDAKINELATKYKKTPAQLVLKFLIQHGHIVIPKSVTKSRIQENFNAFDFQISSEDMDALNALHCNRKYCLVPGWEHHKYYPYNVE